MVLQEGYYSSQFSKNKKHSSAQSSTTYPQTLQCGGAEEIQNDRSSGLIPGTQGTIDVASTSTLQRRCNAWPTLVGPVTIMPQAEKWGI